MYAPKRLAATLAAAAVVAAAAPAGASAATPPVAPPSQICLSGIVDPGPFGPMGPYGAYGPYGKDGPLHGRPNPLGDIPSCGGFFTFILRGGTLSSFVQANLHAAGH